MTTNLMIYNNKHLRAFSDNKLPQNINTDTPNSAEEGAYYLYITLIGDETKFFVLREVCYSIGMTNAMQEDKMITISDLRLAYSIGYKPNRG